MSEGDNQEPNEDDLPVEIAFVGDLTDNEGELTDRILSVPPGGECTLFIDSPGGSPYCAISLTTLMVLRGINATGIVCGECSSAALWPFAACKRRIVTPFSVLLFHPMKWQSEEHGGLAEAAEWARRIGRHGRRRRDDRQVEEEVERSRRGGLRLSLSLCTFRGS